MTNGTENGADPALTPLTPGPREEQTTAVIERPLVSELVTPAAPVLLKQSIAAAPRSPTTWTRIVARLLLGVTAGFVLFVLFELLLTGVLEHQSQGSLLRILRHRTDVTSYDAIDRPISSGPIALLEVPRLHLREVVVQGSAPKQLAQGPGHLSSTPLPGEFGNAVILGHRRTYGAPFGNLGTLRTGDSITAVTGQGRFTYRVVSVRTVRAGSRDVVDPTLDSRLTLVTSRSAFSSDRVAVVAALSGKPDGVPKRPPVAQGREELGTSGSESGLLLAILWTQVLVAGAFLLRRLCRRWPLAAAHLVAVPVVVFLLWVIFISLDRFLPGTI